jgi:aminoglycoside phosphotransferase (APT) family kinase protein
MSGAARHTHEGSWPWPELSARDAAERVRQHLLHDVAARLTPAGEGDFCFAFRARDWIVRVSKHARAAGSMRREACVLPRIADHLPVEVPRPTLHEPDGCPPFTVHREVMGAPLTRAAWEGLPGPARSRAAGRLADFLWALHRSPPRVEGVCDLPRLDEASLADRLRRDVRSALSGRLRPDVLRGLDRALAARAGGDGGDDVALLHCDVAPGHVLYDEATAALTGVIDFGDVALGPPARDFIFLYEDFGPALCEEVLSVYATSAGTEAPTFADVRAWYLLEGVSWTLERLALGASEDVVHGLAEIQRELA